MKDEMVFTKHKRIKRLAGGQKSGRKAVNTSEHRANLINYILDEEKTKDLKYVSDYGFDNYLDFPIREDATDMYEYQLTLTDHIYYEEDMHIKKENDVMAHHLIQSFSPEDNLTPEEINEIGKKLAKEITGGDFQFIVATHVDKKHLHNHIVINNVNIEGKKKLAWNDILHHKMMAESDRLAELHGAKIIEPKKDFTYQEYKQYQNTSHIYQLRQRLNYLLKKSENYEDFMRKAKLMNIKISKRGKKSTTFLMTDTDQVKVIRDRKVNKNAPRNEEWFRRFFAKKELNQRLDFLLEQSQDFLDFKKKAQALGVTVREKVKHVEFQVTIAPSNRSFFFSDEEVNKKLPMDLEFFKTFFENRVPSQPLVKLENISALYEEKRKENLPKEDLSHFYEDFKQLEQTKKEASDFEVVLQDWQVEKESQKGLHVKVWLGLDRQGLLFVPNHQLTIKEVGKEKQKQYTIHLNEKDSYQLHAPKEGEAINRFMMGRTLIKQLSTTSQELPQRKYITTQDIKEKIIAISFINQVNTKRKDLLDFRDELVTAIAKQQDKLEQMSHRHNELLRQKRILEGLTSDDEETLRAARYEYTRSNLTESFTLEKLTDDLANFETLMEEEIYHLKNYARKLDQFVGILNHGIIPKELSQKDYMYHQEDKRRMEKREERSDPEL